MKKGRSTRKLSRTTNERKQLFHNLIREAVEHGFLVTSSAKAKAVKPILEKLVTRAKDNTLASLRMLIAETGDVTTAQGLVKMGRLFKNRPGGYLRLIKMRAFAGNNGAAVRMEWVEKLAPVEMIAPAAVKNEKKNDAVKAAVKALPNKPATADKSVRRTKTNKS